jgi:hypothetical protein
VAAMTGHERLLASCNPGAGIDESQKNVVADTKIRSYSKVMPP